MTEIVFTNEELIAVYGIVDYYRAMVTIKWDNKLTKNEESVYNKLKDAYNKYLEERKSIE